MLLKRLKQLNKQEGGFTFIELVVSIVLVSLISMAVAITMLMLFKVSASSSDRVTAARQGTYSSAISTLSGTITARTTAEVTVQIAP